MNRYFQRYGDDLHPNKVDINMDSESNFECLEGEENFLEIHAILHNTNRQEANYYNLKDNH